MKCEIHYGDTDCFIDLDRRPPRVGLFTSWQSEADLAFEKFLCGIDGVTRVGSYSYSLHIEKGRLFSWMDILKIVLPEIRRICDPDAIMELTYGGKYIKETKYFGRVSLDGVWDTNLPSFGKTVDEVSRMKLREFVKPDPPEEFAGRPKGNDASWWNPLAWISAGKGN